MFVGSKVEIDWDLLQNRYPEIAFALSCSSYDSLDCFLSPEGFLNGKTPHGLLYEENTKQEIIDWKQSLSLEGIDILYVYGIGLGHYYSVLRPWLKERKERKIVFFEEDLSVLGALFEQEIGAHILRDLQVHVYYVPQGSPWEGVLEECVQRWVSDRIEWSSLRSYERRKKQQLKSIRLKLLRRSAAVHAKVGEALHYHVLMQNLMKNFSEIPRSFHANQWKGKFKNIPAIICGAGSSLALEVSKLGGFEQKALIIAGGSAITALSYYGINPHIAIALDPNEEEYVRLRTSSSFETPFIYSSRLHKDVLSSSHLRMGYLCSNTGGVLEAWVHEKLGIESNAFGNELGEEALSVTTLAIAFAKDLGCNPIVLCGVDLAYSNKQAYAPGVLSSPQVFLEDLEKVKRSRDRCIRRKNSEGAFVYTLVKWVMEASCIGRYAKKEKGVRFFNVSHKGLPIPGISSLSLEALQEKYCKNNYNLRGLLHAEASEAPLEGISEASLLETFQELKMSFEEALPLFQSMLEEIEKKKEELEKDSFSLDSWKMDLIEMDLKEKTAYKVCLILVFLVYQRVLDWWCPISHLVHSKEQASQFLEKKKNLWTEGEKIVKECIVLLKNC